MKVKVVNGKTQFQLEDEINEFFKKIGADKYVDMKFSSTQEGVYTVYSAIIIYRL